MKVSATSLPGVMLVEPAVHGDGRGRFFEGWNRRRYQEHGLGFDVVQSNTSVSQRGVLRGLHYQWPNPQGKLVSVLEGEVYDVAVDVRAGSPTFGRWEAAVLTGDNHRQLWIPEGFAHGFVVLSERAIFHYLCSGPYDRDSEHSLRWDDPDVAIDWPVSAPLLSGKDAAAPLLREIAPDHLPPLTA